MENWTITLFSSSPAVTAFSTTPAATGISALSLESSGVFRGVDTERCPPSGRPVHFFCHSRKLRVERKAGGKADKEEEGNDSLMGYRERWTTVLGNSSLTLLQYCVYIGIHAWTKVIWTRYLTLLTTRSACNNPTIYTHAEKIYWSAPKRGGIAQCQPP